MTLEELMATFPVEDAVQTTPVDMTDPVQTGESFAADAYPVEDITQNYTTDNVPDYAGILSSFAEAEDNPPIDFLAERGRAVDLLDKLRMEQDATTNQLPVVHPEGTNVDQLYADLASKDWTGSDLRVVVDKDGNKSISLTGSPENAQFQGMGRYATPEEFMRNDPEGFKRVNPDLAKKLAAQTVAANANPGPTAFQGQLNSALERFNKAATWEERVRILTEMKSYGTPMVQAAHDEAKKTAENQLGIKALEARVQGMQANDRQRGIVSPQTNAAEKMLMDARGKVEITAEKLVRNNPKLKNMLSGLDAEIKILSTKMEMDMKQKEKDDAKRADKLDAATDILQGMDKQAITFYTKIFPDLVVTDKLTGEKTIDKVAMVASLKNNPDYIPMLRGELRPDKYLEKAVLGNSAAALMAIKEQASRTGKTEEAVAKDLNYATRVVNDKKFRVEQMIAAQLIDPIKDAPTVTEMLKVTKTPSQADILQEKVNAISIAEKLLYTRALAAAQDFTKWAPGTSPLDDPKGREVFDLMKAGNNGKTPDILQFAKTYVGAKDITPEERTRRQDILLGGFKKSFENTNGGIFHAPIESGTVDNYLSKLKTQIAVKVVNDKSGLYQAGKWFGDTFGSSAELYANASGNKVVNSGKPVNVLGAMDDFFAGMTR